MRHLKLVSPVEEQVLCTYCVHLAVGSRDVMRVNKHGVECPGTGGPGIAETDARIRQQVVEHWREDPVQVL